MTADGIGKLRSLLRAYAERERPAVPAPDEGERQRRVCGDSLRTIVCPVLEAVAAGQHSQEGPILRFVFWHSRILAFRMGLLVLAQAYWLQWMIPYPA